MLIAFFAYGQNQNVEDVEITAPQFANIKNAAALQSEYPNTLIKTFLKNYIVYPKNAAYCNIEGTEVVRFTVTTEGKVKDFKIVNSVCPEMDKAVVSALELTDGLWFPGTKNGKPADIEIEIPFTFCSTNFGSKSVSNYFNERATTLFSKGNILLFEKGNVKKALKYYEKGVTYLPYDQSLLLLRGLCLYELGDKEGASQDWKRMKDLGGADMTKLTASVKNMKGYNEVMAILKK